MDKPNVIFAQESIGAFGLDEVRRLKAIAESAHNKRARICFHRSPNDPIQQMLLVFHKTSFGPPIRQPREFKSYLILEGSLLVGFFDNSGKLERRHVLSDSDKAAARILRFPASRWHITLPQTEFVVFVETMSGPYEEGLTEYAPWSFDVSHWSPPEL